MYGCFPDGNIIEYIEPKFKKLCKRENKKNPIKILDSFYLVLCTHRETIG